MTAEDITPDDSIVPVFLDDTPQEPMGDPQILDVEPPDSTLRESAIKKVAVTANLTSEETAAFAGERSVPRKRRRPPSSSP